MVQKVFMTTAAGSLMVMMLFSASCAKSHRQAKADDAARDRAVASERMAASDADRASSARMGSQDRMARTERPVPSNRTGSGGREGAQPSDRIVECADAGGDMTASTECAPAGSRHYERDGRQADALAMANCAYHTDDRGRIVYEDQACADRYRGQRTDPAYDPAAMANCRHHTDERGRIIFDDQDCANRYRRQMGSSYQNVRWTQESAFFDRHLGKAVEHAREAEIAAQQGHSPEVRHHAELALSHAKEAQRAGDVPGLNEGITALRSALRSGDAAAAGTIRDARINLARAGGMKPPDTGPRGTMTGTAGAASGMSRTVRGELVADESAATLDGNRRYFLRDRNGHETPILLSSDMTGNLRSGDIIEAQVDPQGRVVAINKATDY
jgi:hypothetical protein